LACNIPLLVSSSSCSNGATCCSCRTVTTRFYDGLLWIHVILPFGREQEYFEIGFLQFILILLDFWFWVWIDLIPTCIQQVHQVLTNPFPIPIWLIIWPSRHLSFFIFLFAFLSFFLCCHFLSSKIVCSGMDIPLL
jgi:hypothetical protein